MGTYEALYQEYISQLHVTLSWLVLLAGFIVIGWYAVRGLLAHSPHKHLAEWIYLAYCALIYIMLVVPFF